MEFPLNCNITVWFTCKQCEGSFQTVDQFIRHKQRWHFREFQAINCIIFEEKHFDQQCKEELQSTWSNSNSQAQMQIENRQELADNVLVPIPLVTQEQESLFHFHFESDKNRSPETASQSVNPSGDGDPDYEHKNLLHIPNHCATNIKTEALESLNASHEPPEANFGTVFGASVFFEPESSSESIEIQVEPSDIVTSDSDTEFTRNVNQTSKKLTIFKMKSRKNHRISNADAMAHEISNSDSSVGNFEYVTPKKIKYADSYEDQKPFRCSIPNCFAAFTIKGNLDRHCITTHTDIRPYKCLTPGCSKAFKTKAHLVKHRQSQNTHKHLRQSSSKRSKKLSNAKTN